MEVRVIGAHQTESAGFRPTAILVDGRLAIDAGGLAGGITLAHQRTLEAVLITHYHYDHIRDLPIVALNRWGYSALVVYTPDIVRDTLRRLIFNNEIWPKLDEIPSPENPALRFQSMIPGTMRQVLDYDVLAVPVPHAVPTVGYWVRRGGKSVFYTGDTGGSDPAVWQVIEPDLLLTEVTFPNRMDTAAAEAKHLTPARLKAELQSYLATHDRLPIVGAVHVSSEFQDEISAELAGLAREMRAEIRRVEDGEVFRL